MRRTRDRFGAVAADRGGHAATRQWEFGDQVVVLTLEDAEPARAARAAVTRAPRREAE